MKGKQSESRGFLGSVRFVVGGGSSAILAGALIVGLLRDNISLALLMGFGLVLLNIAFWSCYWFFRRADLEERGFHW